MGEWIVSAGESQLERPDDNPVAALEDVFVDFLAVDGRPVPAVEVFDHVKISINFKQFSMLIGKALVSQSHGVGGCIAIDYVRLPE